MTPAYSPVLNSTLFDLFAESAPDIYCFVWDLQADYSHWSTAAVEELALPGEYMGDVGRELTKRIHPADLDACAAAFRKMLEDGSGDTFGQELRVQNRSGAYVWVHARGRLRRDKDGRPELFAGLVKDLGTNARCDATTGLLTAHEFNAQLRDALGSPEARGGLLLFGIDSFDRVNKAYGYAFGNSVLRVLAERLLALQPPGTLYRMSGDCFAYWQRDAAAADLEAMFARFHTTAAALPMDNGTLPLSLTGSYVLYPAHGRSAESLTNRMEAALTLAKRIHPSGLYGYTDAMYRAEEHDRSLRAALHRDVENHCANFSLVYQPQIYTKKGVCAAAEATLHWRNPEFLEVPESEFLPILEQTGDILLVGQWMLRTALEQVRIWQQSVPGFGISVNLSGRQLARNGFAESVCQMVARYGLPANTLCVELMPSCRRLPAKTLARVLRAFNSHNITVALDDFGTGDACFHLVRTLPLQWIKLDRSLIRGLATDQADQAIVTSLIDMAHRLHIHVNATGIENEGQRQYATMAGADFLQGHLFSRPLTAQEFHERILAELL